MQSVTFDELVKLIPSLNNMQKEKLYITLKNILGYSLKSNDDLIKEYRETKFSEGVVCPHCGCHNVVRYSNHNGLLRYECKDCNKTFTDFTLTPLNKTHYPEKWMDFIDCMIKSYSLRKSAELLAISFVTLFYWRHKILSASKQVAIDDFDGIIEMDETYFLYSEKGQKHIENRKPRKRGGKSKFRGISHEQICVFVARDREKHTVAKVTCMGRIVKSQVNDLIGNHITSDNYSVQIVGELIKHMLKRRI